MREFGATEEQIDELREQESEEEPYEVLRENWPAVKLYQANYGQFKVAPSGHILGFDHNAVKVDIDLAGRRVSPRTWQKFKILESLTVHLLNSRKS